MTEWRRFELVKAERNRLAAEVAVLRAACGKLIEAESELARLARAVVGTWTDPLDDDVHGTAVDALARYLVPDEEETT